MFAFTARSLFSLSFYLALSAAAMTPTHAASAQEVNFALPGLDKQTVRLTDFRGRWVIVNFWATWCTPCMLEMPELQAFHQTHHARAAVIGVNYEELTADEIRFFVNRLGITFPVALSGGQPVRGFNLKALPSTFLVSPTGKLVRTYLGAVNAAMLLEKLDALEREGDAVRRPD